MADLILIVILVLIVSAAVAYIVKAKKKGTKCIGCSQACNCGCSGSPDNCRTSACHEKSE